MSSLGQQQEQPEQQQQQSHSNEDDNSADERMQLEHLTRWQIGRLFTMFGVQASIDQLPSYEVTKEMAAGRKEDIFTCSICLCDVEIGQRVRVLTCKHEFHAPCIDHWLVETPSCPMCRSVERLFIL